MTDEQLDAQIINHIRVKPRPLHELARVLWDNGRGPVGAAVACAVFNLRQAGRLELVDGRLKIPQPTQPTATGRPPGGH